MIVLSIHNFYQQPGGEDEVVASEVALLRSRGHRVVEHTEHNDRVDEMSRVRVAFRTVWSGEAYRRTRSVLREVRPDVMHVHNTFPLLSPAVYYAARAEGVPVVQTLHNYRLVCPSALLFRDGGVCEDCLGRALPLAGVRHACYRGSRAGSAAVAAMIATHHGLGTWERLVDVYLALTEFGKRKFVEGGLPADRIRVKPNFLAADPGLRNGAREYALFIGRLSGEKGIRTLLHAWRAGIDLPLRVVGDGPLYAEVKQFLTDTGLDARVRLVGRVPPEEVFDFLHGARFLVFPSEWYEGFGRVIIEAFACGVPVLAAGLGAPREIVEDGVSGLHFRAGDASDLAEKARDLASDPARCRALGRRGRATYESRYSAEANYPMLLGAYETAIAHRRGENGMAPAAFGREAHPRGARRRHGGRA